MASKSCQSPVRRGRVEALAKELWEIGSQVTQDWSVSWDEIAPQGEQARAMLAVAEHIEANYERKDKALRR